MRWIGATLLVFLTVIAAADPLCCADGCSGRDVGFAGRSQATTDCPLCQPSVVIQPESSVSFGIAAIVTPIRSDRVPPPAFHLTLDHPPRPA
jgi:hypothetical protein